MKIRTYILLLLLLTIQIIYSNNYVNASAPIAFEKFVYSGLTSQTITFPAIPTKTYGIANFSPGATASSGLTVSYTSSNSAVATIVSGQIHIVGVGTSTITASQAGNGTYSAAPNATQILTVVAASQTITFGSLPTKTYGNAAFSLTASTTSGLTITFTSSNTSVATISGSTVTIVGAGTDTITATQAGNADYLAQLP